MERNDELIIALVGYVELDLSATLDQLFEQARRNHKRYRIDERMTQANWGGAPFYGASIMVEGVHMRRDIQHEEAIACLYRYGMRSCTPQEALTLALRYPELLTVNRSYLVAGKLLPTPKHGDTVIEICPRDDGLICISPATIQGGWKADDDHIFLTVYEEMAIHDEAPALHA